MAEELLTDNESEKRKKKDEDQPELILTENGLDMNMYRKKKVNYDTTRKLILEIGNNQ